MYIFLILKVRVQSLNVMEILFCHLLFSSGVGFVDKKNRKYLYISLLAFERRNKKFRFTLSQLYDRQSISASFAFL